MSDYTGQSLLDKLVDLKVNGVDISTLKVRVVIPQPSGEDESADADEVNVDLIERTLTIS